MAIPVPTGLTAATVSPTRIDLSWTSDAAGADVERDTYDGSTWVPTLQQLGVYGQTFSDTTVDATKRNRYRVRANKAARTQVKVVGNQLQAGGSRWIAYGAVQYLVYPESGWSWTSGPHRRFYDHRHVIAPFMAELGVNSLRIGLYSHTYAGTDSALTQAQWRHVVGDICDVFTAHGIRVIITDHFGTGIGANWISNTLSNFRAKHFVMATDLLGEARIGSNPMVMFEPMNEPGHVKEGNVNATITRADLIAHYKLIIDHYRTAGYTGPLIIDGESWAWGIDPTFASELTTYDAQIAFGNHRYPTGENVGPSQINGKVDGYLETDRARHVSDALDQGGTYPIIVTELGQNIDDTSTNVGGDTAPPRPAWYREALQAMVDDIDANTVQGVTVWQWAWDEGSTGNEGDNRLSGNEYWTVQGLTRLSLYGDEAHRRLWKKSNPPPTPTAGAGVLVTYGFDGVFAPTSVAAGISASHVLRNPSATEASGLRLTLIDNTYATKPVLQANTWDTATSAALAVSLGSYFEFTLTPDSGKTFTPGNLTFNVARGGSSTPRGYVIRTSADNFAADVATADVTTVRPTFSAATVDLSTLGARSTALTIRIYSYSPATNFAVDYDDIALAGTVA